MAHDEVPSQSVQQVLNCQYQEWYPHFKGLSFRSEIIPLPKAFMSYLLDDGGVFLPDSSDALPKRFQEGELSAVDNSEYRRWGEGGPEDEEESMQSKAPSFPELERTVDAAISQLGGTVLPKLNWSCPKDTAWISPSGGVKCNNAAEVFLLLKSSDVIVHDLCHAFDNCRDGGTTRPERFVLVLKKWYPLRPELEFRCFVRDHHLVGICQREVTSFYPSLLETRTELSLVIERFIQDHVLGRFPDPDFVCDVYVTSDRRVKIMDFNPYGGNTLPLLFSWSDFEKESSGAVDLEAKEAEGREALDESVSGETDLARRELGRGLRVSVSGRNSPLIGEGRTWRDPVEGKGREKEPTETSSSLKGEETHAEKLGASIREDKEHSASEARGKEGEQRTGPVELRVIETATGVMPSMAFAGGAPFDLVDLSSGGAIDEFIKRAGEET